VTSKKTPTLKSVPIRFADKPAPDPKTKKAPPIPQDQPTRKSLYDLVRRLDSNNHRVWSDEEYKELERKYEARQKAILDADPELNELQDKMDSRRRLCDVRYNSRSKKIAGLRAMLDAQGVTPAVVKKANELVRDFFPETPDSSPSQNRVSDTSDGADVSDIGGAPDR
jgi:hypothetical protein